MKLQASIRSTIVLAVALFVCLGQAQANAQGADGAAGASPSCTTSGDTMLRAFKDELDRTVSSLKLEGHPTPYFAAYTATEYHGFSISGSFGAVDTRFDGNSRAASVDVRVGDKKFDGSGNQADFGFMSGRSNFSLDDNYDAIRRQLWLITDSAYKRAIESLESKKATLQHKKIEDLPDSMSPAKPAVVIVPMTEPNSDQKTWERTVRDVSSVFKSYPDVIDSQITFNSRANTRWFANTEGSMNREPDKTCTLTMNAQAQASDGMNVIDFELLGAQDDKQLPAAAELSDTAKRLAERVSALAKAPIAEEDYRGPILFEKQAAAEFFSQTLAPNLVNPTENLFGGGGHFSMFSGGLKEKIGRRILPTSVTVVDDPQKKEFNGLPLMGNYLVDDEGVKGERVVLVQNGILKTLCSSRTPSKYIKETNGHCQRGSASTSQIFVTTSDPTPLTAMKQKLLQMGKEDGLKYVLIARKVEDASTRFATHMAVNIFAGMSMGDQLSLSPPTQLYKVNVEDGSEELVRGAKFEHLTTRVWRDIVACGDDTQPFLVYNRGDCNSLVTPSILVQEIDVTRASRETDKPMVLKNPYFRQNTSENIKK